MNNYIYPYNEINLDNSNFTKILEIPIQIDNISSNINFKFKIEGFSGKSNSSYNFSVFASYSESNNNYTFSLFSENNNDIRIKTYAFIENNKLIVVAKASSLTGAKFYLSIIAGNSNNFLFCNEIIDIKNKTLINASKFQFELAENIEYNTSYPVANSFENKNINISCVITLKNTLPANSPIFKNLTNYRINGIAFKNDGTMSFLRRSSSNLINVSELSAGSYMILAIGTINESLAPADV